MTEVSGVIQQIKTKQVGAQRKNAYDIQVSGQWYGYGFFAPKAKEGDYVTFTGVQNGNFWNVERGSLKVGKAPADASGTRSAVKTAVSSFDARQDTISRQAASNTAIEWMRLLNEAGALPAAKSKGQQQALLDTVRREYEKEFYEANTGVEWKDIRPAGAANAETVLEDEAESEASDDDLPW